ncbi:hypothetical protein HY837_03685 [archaeon]|nr:hypothetical protein [archaeon]
MNQRKKQDENGEYFNDLDLLAELGIGEEIFIETPEEGVIAEVPEIDLDKIIHESKNNDAVVKIEKSFEARAGELCYLITKIFSEDTYISDYSTDFKPVKADKFFGKDRAEIAGSLSLYKGKKSLFRRMEGDKYVRIDPVQENKFAKDGKMSSVNMLLSKYGFNPIKVTAYNSEALQQAKVFAVAYKKLTGQEASVVQGFVSKDDIEKRLSKEKKRHNPEMTSEMPQLVVQIKQLGGKATFSLENEVSIPKELENTVEVKEGDKIFLYTGTFYEIRFNDGFFWGATSIKKSEVTTRKKRKLTKYFPPKIGEVEEKQEKETWNAMPRRYDSALLLIRGLRTENSDLFTYKKKITNQLANEIGVVLSDKLLNELFYPIEQTLIDVYQKIESSK